jgi:hypothetical protein
VFQPDIVAPRAWLTFIDVLGHPGRVHRSSHANVDEATLTCHAVQSVLLDHLRVDPEI